MARRNEAASTETYKDRIVRSAYHCFDRYGIAKTTIEDIAGDAGVSRPTVYKFFANKDAILDEICTLESKKTNDEVRARLVRQDSFSDTLTDAILLVVRVSMANIYLRRANEIVSFSSHATSPSSSLHKYYRGLWGRLLTRAADRGDLAADLSIDEVTSWLNSSQAMLMMRLDAVDIDDAELRRLIRRFVVEPLLAPHAAVPVSTGQETAAKVTVKGARRPK